MINGSPYIKFKNPFAKLSQPGDINLDSLWKNFNINLKESNGGMSGFIDDHPYLRDTVHGIVSGATMALNYQDQNRMKKTQRDYLNDPFNLYQTSSMKKYGSYPWLTSTGQFTDFPNEKVPVYEPGYQNSAYTNPMATAKKGGQLYMAFQDGGSINELGKMNNLPKYLMGTASPIQKAIEMDSNHYGIPTAKKGGGFFTPEKLTDNTENYEYYEKPNNFLNYLKDMSANAVVQKALGKKRKGQLSDFEEMGFAQMGMQAPQQAPQQSSEQTSQDQLIQMVAQALQQGASPEEVMQKLVEIGVPENQAMQIVQMVSQQLQNASQEQAPENMMQQAPDEMTEQMPEEMNQQMPMAQMGMGMSGSDFQEFGFDDQNPLNPYYTGMYDPNEAKQANAQLMEGLYGSVQDAFSKPIAKRKQTNDEFYQNMQKLQDMIAKAQQPTTAKYGGIPRAAGGGNPITKPNVTNETDFENWYNTELGKLISSGKGPNSPEVQAFVNQARQWAYDFKFDPSKAGYTNLNPNTVAGSRDSKYDTELEKLIQDSELEYEQAMLNNADQATLDAIEAKRKSDMDTLNKKYPVATNTIAADYYGLPAKSNTPGGGGSNTNTGGGAGGYQFNPAMQKMLELMAQGYTKAPLFGFRTKRNINALFNQTMADMMLKGQGQGTANASGAAMPGAPVVGPGGNAQYNNWIKDNNITRYDIIPGRHGVKMKIRANEPGKDLAYRDANGNIVTQNGDPKDPRSSKNFDPFATRNFDPYARGTKNPYNDTKFTTLTSQFDPRGFQGKNFFEDYRNRRATDKLQRLGSKLDQSNQKQQYLDDLYNSDASPDLGGLSKREANRMNYKGLFDRARRYDKIAKKFNRASYQAPEERYGGAYAMGGQYQEGGTYYLSDEEIQALLDAGYELE